MFVWPLQKDCDAFYGKLDTIQGQLIGVAVPWKLFYGTAPVSRIQIHKKCAVALDQILTAIWDACDHDQNQITFHGYQNYSGSYNQRSIRQNAAVTSMHAYGAAIDWDAADNMQGAAKQRFTDADILVMKFKAAGCEWGGDWTGKSRDAMHVQFGRTK